LKYQNGLISRLVLVDEIPCAWSMGNVYFPGLTTHCGCIFTAR